jgi:hypothetical protein
MDWFDEATLAIGDGPGLAPGHLWIIGLTADGIGAGRTSGPVVAPADRRFAIREDCRCPDDCVRDHPNE